MFLRAPGSFNPRLFAEMRAESELASLIRALSTAPADLDQVLERLLPAGGTLADPVMIERLPTTTALPARNTARCGSGAGPMRWPPASRSSWATLAAEQLAAAGSIPRALDLLAGRGRPPDNDAGPRSPQRVRDADQVLDRIANG